MKPDPKKLKPRFAPDIRFEIIPAPPELARKAIAPKFEALRLQLSAELLRKHPGESRLIASAAFESAAIAWAAPFPLLLLPELLNEKVRDARQRFAKQADVRKRSEHLRNIMPKCEA